MLTGLVSTQPHTAAGRCTMGTVLETSGCGLTLRRADVDSVGWVWSVVGLVSAFLLSKQLHNRYGLTAAATGNADIKMVGYDDTNDYINIKSGAPLQQTIFAGMIVYQNPWSYQAPTWTHPASQENEDTPATPALIHRNDPPTWHMCWLENGRHYDEFIDLLMHVNYRIQVDAFDRLTAAGALGFDAATYLGAPSAWPGGEATQFIYEKTV